MTVVGVVSEVDRSNRDFRAKIIEELNYDNEFTTG